MTSVTNAPNDQPGLVAGIVSIVCAVLGFFIPGLGLLLALIGLIAGIRAYRAGKRANYQAGLILGLIGAIIGGVSLAVASFIVVTAVGVMGGLGFIQLPTPALIVLGVLGLVVLLSWAFTSRATAITVTIACLGVAIIALFVIIIAGGQGNLVRTR